MTSAASTLVVQGAAPHLSHDTHNLTQHKQSTQRKRPVSMDSLDSVLVQGPKFDEIAMMHSRLFSKPFVFVPLHRHAKSGKQNK